MSKNRPAEPIQAQAWAHLGWGHDMPLVKSSSKAAFRKNVSAEVNAGKPVKQAVAIAYSVKRAAPATKLKTSQAKKK